MISTREPVGIDSIASDPPSDSRRSRRLTGPTPDVTSSLCSSRPWKGNPRPSSETTTRSPSTPCACTSTDTREGWPCFSALTTASRTNRRTVCSADDDSGRSAGLTRMAIGVFHSTARRPRSSSSAWATPAVRGDRPVGRLQVLDEQANLPLLDRDGALQRQKPIARGRGRVRLVSQRLEPQADPGQRLEHAVVEVARDADPILPNGDLVQALLEIQPFQRIAHFVDDNLHERDQLLCRAARAAEENPPFQMLDLESGRRQPRLDQARAELAVHRPAPPCGDQAGVPDRDGHVGAGRIARDEGGPLEGRVDERA